METQLTQPQLTTSGAALLRSRLCGEPLDIRRDKLLFSETRSPRRAYQELNWKQNGLSFYDLNLEDIMTGQDQKLEANLSTLILSIGSSAAMAMGLAPNPQNGKVEKNLEIAKFNIDLLLVLQSKTQKNLSTDEDAFLKKVISDLQLKFVQLK